MWSGEAEALEPGVTINHVLQLGFQMKEKAGFMSSSLLGKRGRKEVVPPVSGAWHQAVPASLWEC